MARGKAFPERPAGKLMPNPLQIRSLDRYFVDFITDYLQHQGYEQDWLCVRIPNNFI